MTFTPITLPASVGSYVDAAGVTNGLVYNLITNTGQTVDDPLVSGTPALGNVTGTTMNGINNLRQLVDFYSDGTNVYGLLATPTQNLPPSACSRSEQLCWLGRRGARRSA